MNILEKTFPINNVTIYPKTARITRSLSIKLSERPTIGQHPIGDQIEAKIKDWLKERNKS